LCRLCHARQIDHAKKHCSPNEKNRIDDTTVFIIKRRRLQPFPIDPIQGCLLPFLRVGKSSLWQDIRCIKASHANSVVGHRLSAIP
jgi:hypothetical protein